MIYYVNKIAFGILNPVGLTLLLLAFALFLMLFGGLARRRLTRFFAVLFVALAFATVLFFSLAPVQVMLGAPLEGMYAPQRAEDAEAADAIVVLGGGLGATPDSLPYPELFSGADRVWHAARLYKAGKAPLVIPSGDGEAESTVPFLVDLGVPESAIVTEGESRNTEENALFVQRLLRERIGEGRRARILLVTSAWHMRRSVLMFSRYAPDLDIIPAAADYESILARDKEKTINDVFPSANALYFNTALLKEYLGYWGYSLLR